MSIYTLEQKLEILDAWKKQEISRAAIVRKYGVADQMIRTWEKQYELRGEDGLIPRDKVRNKYTGEFRLLVTEEMLKGDLSRHDISRKYDLNPALLLRWRKLYLTKGPEYLMEDHRGRKPACEDGTGPASEDPEHLKAENDRLKAEVAYLKKLKALVQPVPKKKHK